MGSYAFCCLDLTAKSSKSITFERKYKTPLLAVTHNYVYAGRFTVVMYKSKQTTILYATFIMALSNTQQNGVITPTANKCTHWQFQSPHMLYKLVQC